MGRRRDFRCLAGFLATTVLGTAAHFLYAWSGSSPLVGAFCPVNESVWEHMKLVFFPAFLFSMVEAWFQDAPGFLAARGLSVWVGTALVPVLYYTYTGVLGRDVMWADLAIFFLAAGAVFLLDLRLRRSGRLTSGWQQAAGLAALWLLALVFVLWTYRPPHLPLFLDPRTGLYGVPPGPAMF